jgi:hypothetical protein
MEDKARIDRMLNLFSRFFSRREKTVRQIAMGCYLCPVCDVFTDQPEKHRHEDPVY